MRGSPRALVAAAAALLAMALPTGASAATRYVVPTGSALGVCASLDPCSLTRAVELAEPGDDISIGSGRYGLFALLRIFKPNIDVHGAGPELTRCEFTSSSGLSVGGAGSQVRDPEGRHHRQRPIDSRGAADFGRRAAEHPTVEFATAGAGKQTRQPQFLDVAAGDFHQAPSSPTREAGSSAGVIDGELDLDREGRPVGAPDIGADEEPAGPLVTTGAATATASAVTLNGVVDAQGPATTWSFDFSGPGQLRTTTTVTLPGSVGPTAVSATLDGLSEGTTYTYRLRAANARGIAAGSEASVTTSASPLSPQPPPALIQSVGPDRTSPVLGSLRLTTRRFAVGRALTAIAAATPRATTLRFKVSEPGSVTIEVQRLRPGRRRAGRCVTPTNPLRRVPRCTRSTTFAALRRAVRAGTTTVPFSGRIGTRDLSRRLPTGSYRFKVRAVDNAGKRSDQETIGFTVVTSRARQPATGRNPRPAPARSASRSAQARPGHGPPGLLDRRT